MEGFGLTFNVPARDRVEVRSRVRAALEAQVRRNDGWMVPPDPKKPADLNTSEPEALSIIMGKQMGFELLRQLHAEGERVGMELPDGWRQVLLKRERRVARELLAEGDLIGPEAEEAIRSWIRAAKHEASEPQSPSIPPGEEWLATAKERHRRMRWTRHTRSVRGMIR